MALNEITRLGCGRDIDAVWDRVDSPPDAHERTCADCQAARDSLGALSAATRELGMSDVADPTLQTSPDVVETIVAIARAEVRRGRRIPLRQPTPEAPVLDLMVSEQTIAQVVRRVSDAIPGLETRRCRVELADGPGGGPAWVRIQVQVSVAADVSIPAVIGVLRAQTSSALAAEIGVRVAVVDVEVQDVHDAA